MRSHVSVQRLTEVLARFKGREIAVVGDVILDEFIWGQVDRISPEAPVPVVSFNSESARLGGAANVALNLRTLGAQVQLVGLVGRDSVGDRFRRKLHEAGLDSSGIVSEKSRKTTSKTRLIAHHQQVCRLDREDSAPLSKAAAKRLLEKAAQAVNRCQAVIISDYAKGVVTPALLARLKAWKEDGKFVAVDPKAKDLSRYRGASLITPNLKEAELAAQIEIDDSESLLRAAHHIVQQCEIEQVLVTRGEEGMSFYDGRTIMHFPAVAREVYDVTGAGDTVIAVVTLAVVSGASLPEAATLANHAAGVVVAKLGTATSSVEELERELTR